MPNQSEWRFCGKCGGLFFNGFPGKGVCPSGGAHDSGAPGNPSFDYFLPHVAPPETRNAQAHWAFCGKCGGLFYNGFPGKGVCPAGNVHEAGAPGDPGFNYILPHGLPETPNDQRNWGFCGKCGGLFFNGFPGKGVCPAGDAHQDGAPGSPGFNYVLPHEVPETPENQPHWGFCGKCGGLFFNGFPGKGICPSGGAHESGAPGNPSFDYVLPHMKAPQIPNAQPHWAFCGKCGGLFFNGFPGKGVCPGGGAHEDGAPGDPGFNYIIPHGVPETPNDQANWGFCGKCGGLFFNGFPGKGTCPAGGAHEDGAPGSPGLNYVLPHDLPDPLAVAEADIRRFHQDSLGLLVVGSPVGATRELANGSFEQRYRFGSIVKPLNGPPAFATRFVVTIDIAAIKCFGTDDPSGTDQPYIVVAIYGIDPLVRERAVQTAEIHFGDVDEKAIFARGHPLTTSGMFIPGDGKIQLVISLWEEELARPEKLQDTWRDLATSAIIGGLTMLQPVVGAGVAALEKAKGIVTDTSRELIESVSNFLGLADDHLGTREFSISAEFLRRLIADGSGLPRTSPSIPGIPYNFPELPETDDATGRSWFFEGGGGSYRIFLIVRAAEVTLSPSLQ